MSDRVLINCATYGDTLVEWPAGAYLASYDPEANDGQGHASWTENPATAMVFSSTEAAYECYRTVPANRPIRPDGKPNRPLTLFSIEVVPVTADGRVAPTTGKTMAEILRDAAGR